MLEFIKMIANEKFTLVLLCAIALILALIVFILVSIIIRRVKASKQNNEIMWVESAQSKATTEEINNQEKLVLCDVIQNEEKQQSIAGQEKPTVEPEEPIVEQQEPIVEQQEPIVEQQEPIFAQEKSNAQEKPKIGLSNYKLKKNFAFLYSNNQIRILVRYRKSFMARLIQASDAVKARYAVIHNKMLSYKKVKSRISWNFDSINHGRNKLIKINAYYKTLYLYCSLSPSEIKGLRFSLIDVSQKTKYQDTPILLKIKSQRGVNNAIKLINILANKYSLKPIAPIEDTHAKSFPYDTKENLIKRGLIKVIPLNKGNKNIVYEVANVSNLISNEK